MAPDPRERLAETIRLQGAGCAALGCPFYEAVCRELAQDVRDGGPTGQILLPFADQSFGSAYVLRLLGGVHLLALNGQAPALADHFPSTRGDGDAKATMTAMRELLADPPLQVLDALTRPPQTNEVARSVALCSGLFVLVERLGLPLSLRELGSSAGLNLRLDRYWFEQGGAGWGDPASAVRFSDLWPDGAPPFHLQPLIADRRGCDRDPIDATTAGGALRLLSYVWPEPEERFVRARAAIAIAHDFPVELDGADLLEWLPIQLSQRPPSTTLVVLHSVVWPYLNSETRKAMVTQLAEGGKAATPDAPLAWLRLEPNAENFVPAELRLTLWEGAAEPHDRLVATTGFHGGPIEWKSG